MFTKVIAKQLDPTNKLSTVRITFKKEGVIGKGSFGVVRLVRLHRVSAVEGEAEAEARRRPTLRHRSEAVALPACLAWLPFALFFPSFYALLDRESTTRS